MHLSLSLSIFHWVLLILFPKVFQICAFYLKHIVYSINTYFNNSKCNFGSHQSKKNSGWEFQHNLQKFILLWIVTLRPCMLNWNQSQQSKLCHTWWAFPYCDPAALMKDSFLNISLLFYNHPYLRKWWLFLHLQHW